MHILICDDEAQVAEGYRNKIYELAEKHRLNVVVDICHNADQLLFFMDDKYHKIDVIFLDIGMPGMDGMNLAAELRKRNYNAEIVFLTRMKDRAIDAFDVQAFHYVIKDAKNASEFERVFLKVAEQVRSNTSLYITFQGIGESRNIPIEDIIYFSVNKRIITVHYGSDSFDFYSTMDRLEASMMEYGFIRVQRSYLVNMDHVRSFNSKEITMSDGTDITISRKYSKEITDAISRSGNQ